MSTHRELYQRIKDEMFLDVEVCEFCDKMIAQIDKRKQAPKKENEQVKARAAIVYAWMTKNASGPVSAKDIFNALEKNNVDITLQQISYALRKLAQEEKLEIILSASPKQYYLPNLFDEC